MSNDNGHEPFRVDENLIESELKKGGALVTVQIQLSDKTWISSQIIAGSELSSSRLGKVGTIQRVIQRLSDMISLQ
jgi:hypothetical protein